MSQASHDSETIERQLAALGEDPPSAEELALLAESEALESCVEIAGVARLGELAEPIAFDDLSELETHRTWRAVEQRLSRAGAQTGERSVEPSPGGGPRRWLLATVGLAAAAAVLLIIVQPGPEQTVAANEPSAEEVAELGAQARASLKALDDGAGETERAERLAIEYQRRLEERGG